MSFNMKPLSTSSATSNLTTHRSDTIKEELAKYRQLKSQGTFQTPSELRANTPYFSNNFSAIPSPSGDEFSQSTILALLRLNSSQAGSNISKSEHQLSLLNEESPQLTPIASDSPLLTDLNKLEGKTPKREISIPNNRPESYSESVSRNSLDLKTPIANRNTVSKMPSSTVSGQTKKKNTVSRSIAVEGKRVLKEKENMANFEDPESTFLAEVYKKNTQHPTRTKSVKKENGRYQTEPASVEKKRVNTARIDRSLKDRKINSLSEEKNLSLLSASKTQSSKKMSDRKKTLDLSRDLNNSGLKENIERKTAAPNIEIGATFRPLISGNRETDRLQEEVERWKTFGKTMAESYDALNTKYCEYMKEKETDKKIINALKEQVTTLKAMLKASQEDISRLKDISPKSTTLSSSRTDDGKEVILFAREMEKVKTELRETVKTMDFLKAENEALRRTLEEDQKNKEMLNYYQELAESRFKECSSLAEEIICLRTDLDRSHSNYLRVQRESSARKDNRDSLCSGRKIRQFKERESFQAKSRTFSNSKIKSIEDQLDHFEDLPPSPHDYSPFPFKLEKLNTHDH